MSRFNRFKWRAPRIIGTGMTKVGRLIDKNPTELMEEALRIALNQAKLDMHDLDALIAVPSLSHPHFMEAHHFATKIKLLPQSELVLRTVDTRGAGPITALLEATRMIANEHINKVAIVAGDCVLQMDTNDFLEKADKGCQNSQNKLPSPVIPHGYDRYAQWYLKHYGSGSDYITREHYAMCSVLMHDYARKHPKSMMYNKDRITLNDVLNSQQIAPITNILECARRSDGGAAIIVASTGHVKKERTEKNISNPDVDVMILGGGEASGTLYPPDNCNEINEEHFSCEAATTLAYRITNLNCNDMDWFGLYDCFPIALLRAIESVGLCNQGDGGKYIEKYYNKLMQNINKGIDGLNPNEGFPINTHGGLLGFGAPWEVPAMYSILEAVDQISNKAGNRQINNCRRALVYGNGGIFSHSSVVILSEPVE